MTTYLHHRHTSNSPKSAFTIVELLIVIVVVAILAAISIVAYNGIQERARASTVSSALANAKKKISVWQVDNPGAAPTSLATVGITDDSAVSYQYSSGANGSYCITGTNGTTSLKISDSTPPSSGGCPGHGQGGVAAITNLVTNPSFESSLSGWSVNTPGFTGSASCGSLSNGYSGSNAMRCTASSNGTVGSYGIYHQIYNLDSTRSYTLSAYVRTSVALPFRVTAERRNSSGSNIGTVSGSQPTLAPNTWTRLSLTIPPTPNMDRMTFTIYSGSGNYNSGNTIDFDAVMLTEGTTLHSYADGNTADWIWNSTANNSSSTGPQP